MVRIWQTSETPHTSTIQLTEAHRSSEQLQTPPLNQIANGVVRFAGNGDHQFDSNSGELVYDFELLKQSASAVCEDRSYLVEAGLSNESSLALNELDSSRFVLRNISNNGPSSPVSPKAPYFTSSKHKLVAADERDVDVAIFDEPEPQLVPFEIAEVAAVELVEFIDVETPDEQLTTNEPADSGPVHLQVAYQTQAPVRYEYGEAKNQSDQDQSPVKTKIPTLKSTKSKSKRSAKSTPKSWAKPTALVKQLEALHESPMTAPWAESTLQILNELTFLKNLTDRHCLIVFNNLEQQLNKLEFLTMQASTTPTKHVQMTTGPLALRLREVGYAMERRLEVWPLVHYLATQQIRQPTQPLVDSHNVSQFLLASRTRLNTNEVEQGWADYLQLERAASVFNSLNQKKYEKKKASRAVLARLYSPSLSTSQKKYLDSAIDNQTIGVLKITAAESVELPRLLKRMEKLEASNNGATQFYLNDSYQNLLWSDVEGYQALADRLQTHYRNANFRVSISERQLNRMLPRIPTTREPYRDQVLGAQVVGQNQIFNQMRVSLIPDPNQISMRLESYGKVNSRTTAVRDGITVENAGTSRFRIMKRLAFGQNGIFAYRPETTSHIAQKVVGLRSSVDNIPGIGRLVRNIARSKIEEQAPATKRYAQTKLERKAEQRFDMEIEQRLDELEASMTSKLLHPLIAMDLEPDPIQISTTGDRINMRYRLAGRDQMGASTSRPRGMPNSLINMQVHESALNNITARFELAGKKFTTEELIQYVNEMFGTTVVELDASKSNKPAEFHFAPFDPFRVEFMDGQVVIAFNLRSFRIGEGKKWKNLTIKATYDPLISNGFFLTMNQAEEGVRVKGKRLNVKDQIAVRLVCQLLFPEQFDLRLIPEKMSRQLQVSSLQATQFVIANGWLGLSLDDPNLQQRTPQRQLHQSNPKAHTARRNFQQRRQTPNLRSQFNRQR